MKHPPGTMIEGEKVVLTSYKSLHVPKYHGWMGDEEILRLTASERLTLEEEYKMQKDWEDDPNKCTFIILSRETYEQTQDEILSMIGDTNLFLSSEPDDVPVAEIEVMIAEKIFRRRGCARNALLLIMDYATRHLHVKKFYAKIKSDNEGSIKLFSELGYKFMYKNDIFNE
ncbi:unnamed protein product, partial [Allacma fusca]